MQSAYMQSVPLNEVLLTLHIKRDHRGWGKVASEHAGPQQENPMNGAQRLPTFPDFGTQPGSHACLPRSTLGTPWESWVRVPATHTPSCGSKWPRGLPVPHPPPTETEETVLADSPP